MKALVRSLKDDAEAREIQRALDDSNWNRKVAAMDLNISYKALLYKIKQHGLSPAGAASSACAPKPIKNEFPGQPGVLLRLT